jgi:hypothetical protein
MTLSADVVLDREFEVAKAEVGNARFSDYRRAGQGEVTRDSCGTWKGFWGCLGEGGKHNHVGLDGVNYSGKVFVHPVYESCDRPSCPICSYKGWSGREARKVKDRFLGASKVLVPEHIIVSPSKQDWGSDFEALRKKALNAARKRGVIGGCIIPHKERKPYGVWTLSPHFHILGFFKGGLRCRKCEKFPIACAQVCGNCSGFEALTRRLYDKDGFIVGVAKDKKGLKGERQSVGGTAWYQLNHSSYKVTAKRANVVTWFGTCSYRKLKVVVEKKFAVCPICGDDLKLLEYSGHNEEILRLMRRALFSGQNRDFITGLVEDGVAVWSVAPVIERKYHHSEGTDF